MKNNKKARILVVDDEISIRESLKDFLEDNGYVVDAAGTAEEALVFISKAEYDLSVIDLRLPRMNGETLIKRAHQLKPAMRFIIHTGSVDYVLSKELMAIGMTREDVFFKPVANMMLIVNAIERIVGGQPALS